jgi:hypothetical protein
MLPHWHVLYMRAAALRQLAGWPCINMLLLLREPLRQQVRHMMVVCMCLAGLGFRSLKSRCFCCYGVCMLAVPSTVPISKYRGINR